MFNKLKQFKNLKDRAKEIQNVLGKEKAEGTAGWGKVKVSMDGNQRVLGFTIDPSALSDKAKLEELLKEATNDAIGKIQKIMATKLREVGGMDLAQEFGQAMK